MLIGSIFALLFFCLWLRAGDQADCSSAEHFVYRTVFSLCLQATTDLYGKCTTRHSGTSAAAPEAAGVFALALEAK